MTWEKDRNSAMTSGTIAHEMNDNSRRRPTLLFSAAHLGITSRIVPSGRPADEEMHDRLDAQIHSERRPIPKASSAPRRFGVRRPPGAEAHTGRPPSLATFGRSSGMFPKLLSRRSDHRPQQLTRRSNHQNARGSSRLGGFLQTSCRLLKPRWQTRTGLVPNPCSGAYTAAPRFQFAEAVRLVGS